MKRREFGGLIITSIAGLLASGAALASGKKSTEATAKGTTSAGVANPEYNPNSFYVTITTFFPYAMTPPEYKSLLKNCRNVEGTEKLMSDMKSEGKILSNPSRLSDDKVITCFEFYDEKAYREYVSRYESIPGNFSKIKKELGFRSKNEFKRTVIS